MYAKRTTVSVAKSRAEIESVVRRYKADQFGTATDSSNGRVMIQFRINGCLVRFEMTAPEKPEQVCRQRWRALGLCIKAKLEAVEVGITSFEEEFLAHVVMPDGRRFGEWALPQITDMRQQGKMPESLLLE